ncbi:polysaccharide biosynthesis protein [Legionella israelensis]|uniref:Polysaccharide biosynthesis protein n=1 Tax=Legionella israelensis TaxID=454 RepID=A0AAX1EJX3_9GAMM|nr:nucleoside-diphosphate sugar epimerase/dehydratase [Legionella israelensis]QBR85375.1 polysaccharide biosynthesis protein [Legionella israelensis]
MIKNIFLFTRKLYAKMPVIIFDISAIPIAWYLAYWLRFNMQPSAADIQYPSFFEGLLILTIVQTACYYYFRVYRGLWRFSSLNDLMRILKAAITATFLVIPVFYSVSIIQNIPRSVLPLYSIVLVTVLCGGRLFMRHYWDAQARSHLPDDIQKVLIVGAGAAGEWLVRDLKRNKMYLPVGIVDDSPGKKGLEVHGVRVLGKIRELPAIASLQAVDLIFIAIPSARTRTMQRIVSECEKSGVPFRTLPSITALASGRVSVNALRNVNIEDLLGRDQVSLEWNKIAESIVGHKILVTGGGGSIGSELCRQIMNLKPAKLIILENSEFNLYQIEKELNENFPDIPVQSCLASVTDEVAVNYILSEHKPEIVFHAAAYKHVPMLQDQIRTAIYNNIIGTQIVAQASVGIGVSKFILISTDKAVNPTNVMGTTKRVAEIYCQNLNTCVDTQFITVRFGNVLGSAGSVVPLFRKQLEAGGPLTVTHPEIQRYFMTIPEACQLILQAMVSGSGGEIFVLDMGEPIKIRYLAEQMIRLSGKEPGKDIQIKYTGLRPGEKLFEELFHESEQLAPTQHEKLFKAQFRELDWQELTQAMRMLNATCMAHNEEELFVLLKSLVPEFRSDSKTLVDLS